jgi:glycosyltransferase involved in cell wall biosynthesis
VKVVHICNLPLPGSHPDSARVPQHPGRWVLNLAVAQNLYSGVTPELVVQVPGLKQNYEAVIENIPVYYLSAPDYLRSATLFFLDRARIARFVRKLKPDLVHAHGTEDAYGLAAQSTRLPYVITAQGLFFHINRAVRPNLVGRQRIVQFTEAWCLRRACHVVAKSRYVRDALAARFPNLSLHEIPNTFDQRLLAVGESKRPNSLVYVGTISPHKGVHLLGEALLQVRREIPDVTLDIAGDTPNGGFPYELKQKQSLRNALGDRVAFHGQLAPMELARLVASSAALVAPSLEDMFGNQLIEALLLGTHGIATAGTALAENVRRFGGGTIVSQRDPAGLAAAIVATLRTTGPAKTEEVRRRICDYMGPEVVALQHESLYESLKIP